MQKIGSDLPPWVCFFYVMCRRELTGSYLARVMCYLVSEYHEQQKPLKPRSRALYDVRSSCRVCSRGRGRVVAGGVIPGGLPVQSAPGAVVRIDAGTQSPARNPGRA